MFICADYSSIEARVLAWLAGQDDKLNHFRRGLDVYKVAAMSIYNREYNEIDDDYRMTGKVSELALGYQGWTGAYEQMAAAYNVEIKNKEYDSKGRLIDGFIGNYRITDIIKTWRSTNHKIKQFWYDCENAMVRTIKIGQVQTVGKIKFGFRGNFLCIRLPSGRLLSYYEPKIIHKERFGKMKEAISHKGVDSITKRWIDIDTYGGKIVENITQAVARDIMAEAMLKVEKAGYEIVLSVHDEIIAEHDNPDLDEFIDIMNILPVWADGLPIESDGWIGNRYRK